MLRFPTENFRRPTAMAVFALTAVIGLVLDLWTKYLAVEYLENPVGVIEFIPHWLHFTFVKNMGAVFGMGQGKRALFVIVSVAAVGFLIWLFATSGRKTWYQFVLGMLLAGVLGNMYDRIVYGYVRDMIHALPGWRWGGDWQIPFLNYPGDERSIFPWVFNIADSFLCVGVFLMLVYSLFDGTTAEHSADQASAKNNAHNSKPINPQQPADDHVAKRA